MSGTVVKEDQAGDFHGLFFAEDTFDNALPLCPFEKFDIVDNYDLPSLTDSDDSDEFSDALSKFDETSESGDALLHDVGVPNLENLEKFDDLDL
eukprot:4487325-Karenia_brevis.AAC.1